MHGASIVTGWMLQSHAVAVGRCEGRLPTHVACSNENKGMKGATGFEEYWSCMNIVGAGTSGRSYLELANSSGYLRPEISITEFCV